MKAILLAVLLAGLGVLPAVPEPEYLCKPLDTPRVGQLGCSVHLHGSSLVVGANLDGGGSITACHPSGDSWPCDQQRIHASDGRTGDEFGRSVSIDGHWLAVGAPFADSPRAGGAGVVYLFWRDSEASPWTEKQKIFASDGARGDQLGLTAALSGDTLIVGSPNVVGNAGSLSGAVYVFHLEDGTWTQKQKLTASDARPFDNFGFSLAIDGNLVVIGAPFHDGAGGNSGAAYVFEWNGNTWSQTARLAASDAAADDEYGSAVAVSGSSLAVGARTDDVRGMQDAGSVYVYKRTGGGWSEEARFFGEAAGDRFGSAVSLSSDSSGDQLLIGAPLRGGSPEPGTAYPFSRPDGASSWAPGTLSFLDSPVTGRFGQAVSTDGKNLLVGAYLAPGGGSAAVCRRSPPPFTADLALVKSAPVSAKPGQTITYTLMVTNHGPDKATGIHLEDPIPAGLQPVSLPRYCMTANGKIVCTLPDLSSGAPPHTVLLHFTVLETCATAIINHATVSANEKDPNPSNNSDQASTALTRTVPSLALVKTAPASVKPRDTITYTLTVTNHGTCTATGVHLEDPIPAGFPPVMRSLQPPCVVTNGQVINCVLPGDLHSGQSQTVHLDFTVPETCATPITNRATVSSNEEGPVQSNQVSTAIVRTADLMISKTAPASVQHGDPIPYTLTVTNLGPDIACGVTVSDSLPSDLGSPALPAGSGCSLAGKVVSCSITQLPASSPNFPGSFTVSFTAPQAAACGAQITNTATVSAAPPVDPHHDNDLAMATTTVDCPCPPPSITKTDGLTTAFSGDTLTYTIVVNNPCKCQLTVSDSFPADLLMVRWCRDTGGHCVPSQAGPLQEDLTDATATYRVQGMVRPMFTGPLSNTASVTGSCGFAEATDTTEIVLPPGVTVLCKGIDGTQVEGGTVIYTFLLLNGGPADQANAMFTDLLPAGLTLISATASSPGVTMTNPVTWNGPIPVGGMVTITITAMIGAGTKGMTFCNAPTIAFDRDGDGTNESSGAIAVPCCFTVPATIPALSEPALATLVLLLALLGLRRLRRRSL